MVYQYILNFSENTTHLNPNIILKESQDFIPFLNQLKVATQIGFDIETFSYKPPFDNSLNPDEGEIRTIQLCLLRDEGRRMNDEEKTEVNSENFSSFIPHNSSLETSSSFIPHNSSFRNSLVVDLGWTKPERELINQQLNSVNFWEILADKLSDPNVEIIGHSLDFEQRWMLAKYNIKIRCIRDTKLMSQIYWAGLDPYLIKLNNKPHSLASVGLRLGLNIDKTSQTSNWGWGDLGQGKLSNQQLNYAAFDAEVVLTIYHKLTPLLQQIGVWNSFITECHASPAFAMMSHYGMPVNETILHQVIDQYQEAYNDLINQLKTTFPESILHLYSPKKLAKLINNKFKLKLSNVSAESLSDKWEIPELRLISVIKTTKTYLDYLHSLKINLKNGYVRGNYTQINRKGFGRSSCHNPNLQNPANSANFPPELKPYNLPPIRSVFKAHSGTVLIIADLSKAHSRIAAQASQDPELISRFNSDTQDIFCTIAATIAELENKGDNWTEENIRIWAKDKTHKYHQEASLLRSIAKSVHYGSQNLQGAKTLAKTIRTGAGISISLEQAKQANLAWKQTYSMLAQFQHQIIRNANQLLPNVLGINEINSKTKFGLGYVKTLTGRGVFLPKYPQKFNNRTFYSVKGPDATAAYWSMAEADIIKQALGDLVLLFDQFPHYQAYIANMCHDEIDVVCNSNYALEVAAIVQNTMRQAMANYITIIPVDEAVSPDSLITETWQK